MNKLNNMNSHYNADDTVRGRGSKWPNISSRIVSVVRFLPVRGCLFSGVKSVSVNKTHFLHIVLLNMVTKVLDMYRTYLLQLSISLFILWAIMYYKRSFRKSKMFGTISSLLIRLLIALTLTSWQ
ncbi:hypothetical protein PR048_005541 [Dryococelus australis]|uniref:Uncharacterized protein n=1 Tax=Dryococelus australis TaxID=614101 RepID=A0ABQ9I9N8_9NEOP|nr:hypothetical protein PR048_005541 [Dryococelus australis]